MKAFLFLLIGFALPLHAAEPPPILIGEINSYTKIAVYTEPYKKGWMMALDEINAKGLLGGRKIKVISRDDAGKPQEAVKIADDLVKREKVSLLMGGTLANVAMALSDYAKRNKTLLLVPQSMTDALTMSHRHPYVFRLRANTYMHARILAERAAKIGAKRWATIAPNYEYGQSAVRNFKYFLKELQPDVEFVAEQWPQLGKLDAGATVQAIAHAKPDAVFNALFFSDLAEYARESKNRGFDPSIPVFNPLGGDPESLAILGNEAPLGWVVTGYPAQDIKTPAHQKYSDAFKKAYSQEPTMSALIGYSSLHFLALAIEKAESTETDAVIAALETISYDSPIGRISFRPQDHQSDMGAWIGVLGIKDGKPAMTDYAYKKGADYLPDSAALKQSGH